PDDQLPSNALANPFNDGLRLIVDAWGNPIVFRRWPKDFNDLNPGGALQNGINDIEDPKGTLSSPGWVGTAGWTQFVSAFHNVGPGQSFNLQPTIVSAGRNGILNDGDDIHSYKLRQAENRGD